MNDTTLIKNATCQTTASWTISPSPWTDITPHTARQLPLQHSSTFPASSFKRRIEESLKHRLSVLFITQWDAKNFILKNQHLRLCGGEGGIRTLGTIARTTVFETAPFDRSGTSPWGCVIGVLGQLRKHSSILRTALLNSSPEAAFAT